MANKTWTPSRNLSRARAITARKRKVLNELAEQKQKFRANVAKVATSLHRLSHATWRFARAKATSFFI